MTQMDIFGFAFIAIIVAITLGSLYIDQIGRQDEPRN